MTVIFSMYFIAIYVITRFEGVWAIFESRGELVFWARYFLYKRYLWRKKREGKKRKERKEEKRKERRREEKEENGGFCSESSSDRRYSRVRGKISIILYLCMYMYVLCVVLVWFSFGINRRNR